MEQDYLKYLKTEREISEFKIESLKKMLHKGDASTKRLLAIEEEFIKIPFEKLAGSLSELLSAIKIFRDSRTAFHNIYKEEVSSSKSDILQLFQEKLKKKILDIDLSLENLKIKNARERARVLIILLSMFLYINESINKIQKMQINIDENDLLVEIKNKYDEDIFVFYNYVIDNAAEFDFLTKNAKNFILEIKKLENISIESDFDFFKIKPTNFRNKKIFGFFIPSKHSGRETLKPYHMSLYDEDGLNISKLFSLSPRAVLLNKEYYKFISIVSLNDIKNNIVLLERYEELMKKIFHLKLSGRDNLKIDINKSSILIPHSRTEDDGIRSALNESSAIFSNILTSIL